MTSIISLVLLVVCFNSIAFAGNPDQGGAIIGTGAQSCSEFLTHSTSSSGEAQYVQWTLGFISGVNYSKRQEIGIKTGKSALMKQLETYCREHPFDKFGDAVIGLYQKLSERAK